MSSSSLLRSMTQPSVQNLDAQIADLQMRARNSPAGNNTADIQRLLEQRNQMVSNDAQSQAQKSQDADKARIEGARTRIRELTEGRADELRNDKVMGSSQNFLQAVLSGKETPFNSGVQNAMLAQNAKGTAAAEQAQMQALREAMEASGGSIYDPSFRAKQAELMANRQGANLDAQGQLASQANLANFDAKAGAANSLASQRLGQNAQINQMGLAGAGYRAQEAAPINQRPLQQPAQQSAQGIFAPLIMGSGYQPQPAPVAAPAPQPQQQRPVAPQPQAQPKPTMQQPSAAPGMPGSRLAGPPAWLAGPVQTAAPTLAPQRHRPINPNEMYQF